jgi:Domain of unknown function (DUF4157)
MAGRTYDLTPSSAPAGRSRRRQPSTTVRSVREAGLARPAVGAAASSQAWALTAALARADTAPQPARRRAVDAAGPWGGVVDAALRARIAAARTGGRPLDPATGAELGSALGADLGHVRVHTDVAADRLSRSLNAEAFTVGSDMFFRASRFQPTTTAGRRLLAHELTHVIQQGGGRGSLSPQRVGPVEDTHERAADRAADQVATGVAGGVPAPAYGPVTIRRNGDPERLSPRERLFKPQAIDFRPGVAEGEAPPGGPTEDLYLCGHGVFDFNNGLFTVPNGVRVTFIALHGRKLDQEDTLRVLEGKYNRPPERVVEAGSPCPNMTLKPERREEGMAKEEYERQNRAAAAVGGRDILMLDADDSLANIIRQHGRKNYVWNCCQEYVALGRTVRKRVHDVGFGTRHVLGDEKNAGKVSGGGWVENVGEYASQWDWVSWAQDPHDRTFTSTRMVKGRIDGVEVLSSGTLAALDVSVSYETSKISKRSEIEASQLKAYTVLIPLAMLKARYMPGRLQRRADSTQLLHTLEGKQIDIKKAKTLGRNWRFLVVNSADDFSIRRT